MAALIAAGLYGNIGIKVFYNNLLMDVFNAPPLITRGGKLFYAAIVPVWWVTAFVIAAAIPYYIGFVGVIAASTLMNLTYAVPPFVSLGYDCQRNAMRSGEGFDPATGKVVRHGSTTQRWWRGFCSGGTLQVAMNVWHVLYFLCSLVMCGLGMYAAVDGYAQSTLSLSGSSLTRIYSMIVAFQNPQVNAFTCVSPLNIKAQSH